MSVRGLFLTFCLAASCSAPLLHADVQVTKRVDEVHLTDGTVIDCVVLMETSKGVLIVELDPADAEKTRQRIIPREEVEKVVHGETDLTVAGFKTDPECARKVILASGYRKEETKPKKKDGAGGKDAGPKGPTGPANNPAAAEKVAALAKAAAKRVAKEPKGEQLTAVPPRDLAEAYLSRFPDLRDAAQSLLGIDRVPQMMELAVGGDQVARQQAENIIRPFLTAQSGALGDKPVSSLPVKHPKGKSPAQPKAPAVPKAPAPKDAPADKR